MRFWKRIRPSIWAQMPIFCESAHFEFFSKTCRFADSGLLNPPLLPTELHHRKSTSADYQSCYASESNSPILTTCRYFINSLIRWKVFNISTFQLFKQGTNNSWKRSITKHNVEIVEKLPSRIINRKYIFKYFCIRLDLSCQFCIVKI